MGILFAKARWISPFAIKLKRLQFQIAKQVRFNGKIIENYFFLLPGNVMLNMRPEDSGIIRHSGPAHPRYSTVDARLRSFKDWPPALKQRPAELAEAGFYYIGLSDQVKCFYCDGGLRNWCPEDNPWTEHSRWFSKCGFIRLVKGDEFINKCLIDKPPENLPGVSIKQAFYP